MEKKNISNLKFKIASIIATYFNIGNIKYAPGTFGSLATFPLFFILNFIFLKFNINSLLILSISYLCILIILFILAFWSIDIYIAKNKKQDPSEVVIDEVVGQMIAFIIPSLLLIYYFTYVITDLKLNLSMSIFIKIIIIFSPIIFFRIFDILKPGLIGYFDEKVEGATGIIMDDVIAGLYAGLLSGLLINLFFAAILIF